MIVIEIDDVNEMDYEFYLKFVFNTRKTKKKNKKKLNNLVIPISKRL